MFSFVEFRMKPEEAQFCSTFLERDSSISKIRVILHKRDEKNHRVYV